MSVSSNPTVVIVHISESVAEEMLASPLRKAGFPILAISYRKEDLISLLTQHQPDVLIVNLSFYDPDMRLAVARRLPQLGPKSEYGFFYATLNNILSQIRH